MPKLKLHPPIFFVEVHDLKHTVMRCSEWRLCRGCKEPGQAAVFQVGATSVYLCPRCFAAWANW